MELIREAKAAYNEVGRDGVERFKSYEQKMGMAMTLLAFAIHKRFQGS